MRSTGGGGDALVKNFNLTNCGPCYGLLGRRLHITMAGVGGGGGGGLVVEQGMVFTVGYLFAVLHHKPLKEWKIGNER